MLHTVHETSHICRCDGAGAHKVRGRCALHCRESGKIYARSGLASAMLHTVHEKWHVCRCESSRLIRATSSSIGQDLCRNGPASAMLYEATLSLLRIIIFQAPLVLLVLISVPNYFCRSSTFSRWVECVGRETTPLTPGSGFGTFVCHSVLYFPFSQVLFPTKDIGDLQTWYGKEEETLSDDAKSIICKTLARKRMQASPPTARNPTVFECARRFHQVFFSILFLMNEFQ